MTPRSGRRAACREVACRLHDDDDDSDKNSAKITFKVHLLLKRPLNTQQRVAATVDVILVFLFQLWLVSFK